MGSWPGSTLEKEHLMINLTWHPTSFPCPKDKKHWMGSWGDGFAQHSPMNLHLNHRPPGPCKSQQSTKMSSNLQLWATIHILDAWKWGSLYPPFSEQPQNLQFCSTCWWYNWSQHLQLFVTWGLWPLLFLRSVKSIEQTVMRDKQEGKLPNESLPTQGSHAWSHLHRSSPLP